MLSRCIPILVMAAVLAALAGCAGGAANAPAAGDSPTLAQLQASLDQEFARLGIDPDRVTAAVPHGPENAVFDLTATLVDPDGAGGEPATGVLLNFSERAVGDYDENGEVNASDLTPLGVYWRRTVTYQDSVMFDGIPYVPTGDPTDDGGAGEGNLPAPGSGAENWRLARVDGDANGEINIADITPIATHWQQRLDGYQVYRKGPGETVYSVRPNGEEPLATVSIIPPAAQPGRPVLLSFTDYPSSDGTFEYYVVPADMQIPEEGPQSNIASVDWAGPPPPVNDPPTAALVATPDNGAAPLDVQLDTSGSTDTDGTIVKYEFDPENTGTFTDNGSDPVLNHTYTMEGTYIASVRVTDDDDATDTATATVTVTAPGTGHKVSGTVFVLTADWPLGQPPQRAPLAGVVVSAYASDGVTKLGDSAPSAANGTYTINNVPDQADWLYVRIDTPQAAVVEIKQPMSGEYLVLPFNADAIGRDFTDSGGFTVGGT